MFETSTTTDRILEFDYAGGFRLKKVSIVASHISAISLPIENTYGCIITTNNGKEYPVVNSYDNAIKAWRGE